MKNLIYVIKKFLMQLVCDHNEWMVTEDRSHAICGECGAIRRSGSL
jgi:hypothetical protein